MARKRVTELFPFLVPIRIWQRNIWYQIKLYFDKNKYSKEKGELLPYEVCSEKTFMINENSGQDIIYQVNKVDNLKIISKTMNSILIKPGETFSFCYLARYAKKYGKYKDGLVLVNNKIVPQKGGGICHLSNLLYQLFLQTPLTIVERHGHKVKSFPNPDSQSLEGIDATINSGWLDLKVRNDTDVIYQISIDFDKQYMYGKILSNEKMNTCHTIINDNFKYIKKKEKVYESVSVIKIIRERETGKEIERVKLYDEVVEIKYELPKNVEIEEIV